MLLGKQSDVKRHLSALHHTEINPQTPISLPVATDASLTGTGAIAAQPTVFAADYAVEHTTLGQSGTPAANSTGSGDVQPPQPSKSAQA